jgi:A/G-specific adenine glycosylase
VSKRQVRAALLTWYDRARRDLPWRRTADPWAVLVSEFMLQQTRVSAALGFYERFMARFPTARDAAQADEADLLALWQGLGYYSRARNLRLAAQHLADQGLPSSLPDLRKLPGVGEYTAAAIASRVLGTPAACVDGNVERVLTRLFAIEGPPRRGPARAAVREAAQALVDPNRPGHWNQAVMELGALVCLPGEPRCADCPAARFCLARRRGLTDRLPERVPGRRLVSVHHVCAVCEHRGEVLVRRVPPGRWWEGLWEFPRVASADGETVLEAALRAAAEARAVVKGGTPLATVRHTVTHHCISLHPVLFRAESPREGEWREPARLSELPMPAPQRRVAAQAASFLASKGPCASGR